MWHIVCKNGEQREKWTYWRNSNFYKPKVGTKIIFKISIATNAPIPFIHRFIKKEENKKEVLKTFEKEEISKPLLDANKQILKYDFLQEFVP